MNVTWKTESAVDFYLVGHLAALFVESPKPQIYYAAVGARTNLKSSHSQWWAFFSQMQTSYPAIPPSRYPAIPPSSYPTIPPFSLSRLDTYKAEPYSTCYPESNFIITWDIVPSRSSGRKFDRWRCDRVIHTLDAVILTIDSTGRLNSSELPGTDPIILDLQTIAVPSLVSASLAGLSAARIPDGQNLSLNCLR